MKIRLAGIEYDSLVNGEGTRTVIFAQGCRHHCPGCFNPETHDFNGGELFEVEEIFNKVKDDPFLEGVTFSGGDPLEQAEAFSELATMIKDNKPELNIWCWTGYTIEQILEQKIHEPGMKKLLEKIDVLVDGRFEQSLFVDGLKFRGSKNQRIIDINRTRELNYKEIIVMEY
jgi:anaerobic ribonucleoside-triphosphate reductase activating protein